MWDALQAFQSMSSEPTSSMSARSTASRKSTMFRQLQRAEGATIPSKPMNAAAAATSWVRW
jgi:hypothetical protein